MTRDRVASLRRLGAVHSGIFALLAEAQEELEGPDIEHELASYSLQDAQELLQLHAELTYAKRKKPRKKPKK